MINNKLTRKDFLKLSGMIPLGLSAQNLGRRFQEGSAPNIVVLVFDAWSGHHLPFLGYSRDTTPHISKRLERAWVYHNHYSAGNSTTPGTASLLSGTYPWTHRSFSHDAPPVEIQHQNLFNAVGPAYFSQMYTHNQVANRILKAFRDYADLYINRQELFLTGNWIENIFGNDYDAASVTIEVAFKHLLNHNSLFLRDLYVNMFERNRLKIASNLAEEFPAGPPSVSGHLFTLETAVDRLLENIAQLPQPLLSYFHFLPPHAPYEFTRAEFIEAFNGKPHDVPSKEEHFFSQGQKTGNTERDRKQYDEFILYVDAEFERIFSRLESSGALENTWVILTSDHGELFERGIIGHTTKAMFAPLLRVPLMIFGPGITQRQDFFSYTSSLDVLPTLAHLAGQPLPEWREGELLPGFRTAPPDPERSIYAVNAKYNEKYAPITTASISMLKENFRLSAYMGYPELGDERRYELYDLDTDPHELKDIYSPQNSTAIKMIDELDAKLDEVNRPYE